MNIDLIGKKAIVCGSTQGIGKAIAVALAESGAEIILVARNEEKLKEVKDQLSVRGGQQHKYLIADFFKPDLLKSDLEKFLRTIDSIHILINNTGGPPPGPVTDATVLDFQETFSKHLICNHILAQAVLPFMKKEKYGRIINIISTSVKEPIMGLGVSNTIRAAVAAWSKTLSSENALEGITVNNILPGYTRTGRLSSLIEQKALKAGKSVAEVENDMKKEIPAGRFADAGEPASLAVFLASPYAAYINGVNIQVDGGKTRSF